jgi:hypothetical protein
MTDRTAAALASALPAGNIKAYDDNGVPISLDLLAEVIADRLAESGWRLVHADDDGTGPVRLSGHQTFAEYATRAQARVLDPDQVHDHVEASDE